MRSIACLFLIMPIFGWGQNLVPNPSFEEYEECPNSLAELAIQTEWVSWQESPDYYNVCNNNGNGLAGIPVNAIGNQMPITGDAYSGLATYASNGTNIREYMAIELSAPLDIGQSYYIQFYTNQAEGETGTIPMEYRCATNHIGIRFFKDPLYNNSDNIFQPDNIAHLDYEEVLDDADNWVLISGWFTADDNYDWVAIGNFFDDAQTEVVIQNETGKYNLGYYYIENICISSNTSECSYLLNNQECQTKRTNKLFPNPFDDQFTIEFSIHEYHSIIVLNSLGELVAEQSGTDINYTFDLSELASGIYYLSCKDDSSIQISKLIKQ